MARIARILFPILLIPLFGIPPRHPTLDHILTQAYRSLEQGDHLMAAEFIAQAASFTPRRGDLWEQAGRHALAGGSPASAIDYLQRAAETGDLSIEGRISLGDASLQVGDFASAIQNWETALASGSSRAEIRTRLIQVFRQQKDYAGEIEHRRALLELNPGDARLAYQLGLVLAATSPESAPAYLSLARDLDPTLEGELNLVQRAINSARRGDDPAFTLLSSGRALAQIDEWELAAAAFDLAVQSRPDYAEAWAYLGEARQHLDQDGLPELLKALEIDRQSVSVNTFLALYWQRNQRFDLSLVYLRAALKREPNNPAILAELGNAHALNGDLATAFTYYQQAIELTSRDPRYWRMLAEFSVKYDFEVQETGLPAAQQALELDPEDPISLDVLAQVLLLLGDLPAARSRLHSAIQADPAYAPAHLHLGVVYLETGDTYLAYQQLSEAQSLAQAGSPTAEHAHRLLEQLFP